MKSKRIWKEYKRITEMMKIYSENSKEWHELNCVAWELIGKYVESICKELKIRR